MDNVVKIPTKAADKLAKLDNLIQEAKLIALVEGTIKLQNSVFLKLNVAIGLLLVSIIITGISLWLSK